MDRIDAERIEEENGHVVWIALSQVSSIGYYRADQYKPGRGQIQIDMANGRTYFPDWEKHTIQEILELFKVYSRQNAEDL